MQYVGLLRGVNVGGGNKVPMVELRTLCEGMGWTDVRTYIASGNLMFRSNDDPVQLSTRLRTAMTDQLGVNVQVLVLPGQELVAALKECPIVPERGNQLHAAFLWGEPLIDWSLYEALKTASESIHIAGRIAWIHTPDGYGRSKLADGMPKILGVDFTARNLNTLSKIAEML